MSPPRSPLVLRNVGFPSDTYSDLVPSVRKQEGQSLEIQKNEYGEYEIELSQSVIDSFARFLVPEIRKYYSSEQGQKEYEAWRKEHEDS